MPACDLCGLAVGSTPVYGADGRTPYCCTGCRAVDELLDEPLAERDETEVTEEGWEGETAFYAVDGMHCATCALFIERATSQLDGVTAVDASYASETVRVAVDSSFDEDTLNHRLERWGYQLVDRDGDGTETQADDGVTPRLLLGVIFGMMTMVWYVLGLYPTYFGYDPVIADLSGLDGRYLLANIWVMTTIVLVYTGGPLLRGSVVALRARQPSMDLLVSLAAVGAYTYSGLAVLVGRTDVYFDITVAVILVVTVGRYYEDRIRASATDLIGELTALRVTTARLYPDGAEVNISAVTPGEQLLVRAGERIPIDGIVVEGRAAVDESLLTGAAIPRERGPGDRVAGGTIVTDEPLVIEAASETESALDRIVDRLWHIQSARPGAQQLATRLAIIFVPVVIALATASTAVALATGRGPSAALLLGLTVVIVSCPCALGLATPLAIARGVKAAAARGIILTAASVIEVAPDIETVVFDKTGTLTAGDFRLTAVAGHADALAFAAAVETRSSHPIGRAIVDAAETVPTQSVTDVTRIERGIEGRVGDTLVIVGDRRAMAGRGQPIPDALDARADRAVASGYEPVFVAWDDRVRGVLVLEDRPRSDWTEVLDAVAADHTVVVLTGDEGAATERVRNEPAVDHVFAGVPPEAKAETVDRLRADGPVAMVGDGTNDAPALAAADIGIAFRSGTELAADAADVVVLGDDLQAIPDVLGHASSLRWRVRQNLAWAFLYNAVAIPAAIVGLLNPLVAALAMMTSSLLVVLNSSRGFEIESTEVAAATPTFGEPVPGDD